MNIDDFVELARERRTIRRFKQDAVPDEYITKMIEAARFAQSGGNAQPWEFIVVKDKEKRMKIAELVGEQHQYSWEIERTRVEELRHPAYRGPGRHGEPTAAFKDAPVFIVVCGDPRRVQASVLSTHFLPNEGGPFAHFLKNMANATQILTLAAAACGLGTQWVSISNSIEPRMKEILGMPVVLAIHTVIPVGYPDYTPAPSYRREFDEVVHYEKYDMAKYSDGDAIYNFILNLRKRTIPAYPYKKNK